jgi:hypothetical protein
MGRSYVVSDEDLADEALLWSTDLAQGDGAAEVERLDPAHVVTAFEPPPGGHRWVMGVFPPESDPDLAASRRQIPGMDERGVHGTRTIDYDLVLDGSLQLDLDEGRRRTGRCAARMAQHRRPARPPAGAVGVPGLMRADRRCIEDEHKET